MADGIPVETNPGYIPNSANTAFLDWLRGKAKGRGVPTWDTPKGNPTYGRIGGYPGWEPGMPRAPGNTPMPGSNRFGGTYAPSNNMPMPTQTPPISNTGGPPGGSGLPSVGSGPPSMGSGLPSGGGAMPPGGGTRALPPPLGGGAFGASGGTIPGGVRGTPMSPVRSMLGKLGGAAGAAGLGAAASQVGSSPDVGWPARTKGADPLAVLQKLRQQQGGSPAQPPPASFNDRFGPTPIPNAPATPPPAQPIPPAVAGATPPIPVGGGGAGIGMGSSPPPGWNPQQPIGQWPKQPSPAVPASTPTIPMPRPRPAVRPPAPRSSITVGPKAWAMSPQQYAQAHRPQQPPEIQPLLNAIFRSQSRY